MGSIKANKTDSQQLTEEEFNYVMNINQAKQGVANEYNRVLSAFLNYVAKSRMGYKPEQDLQFELDFSDKSRTLKITKL